MHAVAHRDAIFVFRVIGLNELDALREDEVRAGKSKNNDFAQVSTIEVYSARTAWPSCSPPLRRSQKSSTYTIFRPGNFRQNQRVTG
jgi:hypothetical protein